MSPAVESIVSPCLEADPDRRYQTARQLQEDLERQLNDRPLGHAREPSVRERARKWARRHPRLASSTSVAVLALMLFVGLGGVFAWRQQRLAGLEAAESFRQFHDEMREAQVVFLDAATGQVPPQALTAACRRPLDRYHVLDDPSWQQAPAFRRLPPEEQERLRAGAGELLFLLAGLPDSPDDWPRRALELNLRAESCYPDGRPPAALLRQRAALEKRLGRQAEGERLRAQTDATPVRTSRDYGLLACTYAAEGRLRRALPLWEQASVQDPQNVWVWYGLGHCYEHLARPAQAAACYTACIALDPAFHGWYFRRGLVQLRDGQYRPAGMPDFDQAIRLWPDHAEAHVNRAIARLNDDRCAEAVQDLTRALELGAPAGRIYLMRAQARDKAGDPAGAARDRARRLAKTNPRTRRPGSPAALPGSRTPPRTPSPILTGPCGAAPASSRQLGEQGARPGRTAGPHRGGGESAGPGGYNLPGARARPRGPWCPPGAAGEKGGSPSRRPRGAGPR